MCKKSLLMMLLMALFAPWAANAQTTVEIGDGTATCNTNPIGTYYNYSITEQLYTAEEIGTAGTISSISFYYKGIAARDLPITVYMKHVDEVDLASGGITLADADEVFSGTLPVTTTAGWVTINLANPYAYDGTSNLLIGCIKDYLYYFSGQSWQGTATTATMARYTQSDSAGPYTTSTVPGSAQTNRPNIQIEITPSGSGPTCTKPSTLDVTDITGFGATCTWENTGAASYTFEWKKATDSDYTVVEGLTANTYPLSGLEPYTAYSVRVKAVCGTDLESGYKSATFTTLDVCPDGKVCIGEGTATNSYLPTYNYYNYSYTQQIYTADEIGEAALIESVDIYSVGSVTRNLEIYMVNTEKITFDSVTDWIPATEGDLVFSGSVAFAANSWNTMEFSTPFIYNGRTNVALIVRDVTGSYVSSINFFVFNAQGNQAIRAYRDTPGAYDITAPGVSGALLGVKNRVRFGVSELPACLWPTNLAVSNVTAHTAELSWTSDGTAWQIGYSTDGFVTEQYVEVTENPYTLTGLNPETDYEVRVQKNCGGGTYSVFCTPVAFTTEPSCYAPTDMVISDITAYSANVSWSPSEGTFEVRYSPDVRPTTTFDDSQMHGWTNIDADGDGYEWVLGSECGGIYLVEGGSLAGTGHNSSADMVTSGSYSNFTGGALTPDNYLVSPQITLGGSISFWACAQDASYAAEHFGVAVSTTGNTDAADFTTIQEWDMTAKSAPMLRSSNAPRGGNRAQGNWYQYTVDLSAYSGQGYVAIRHFDCTDMFMLNVDDIYIEQPGFEMPWVYPTTLPALTNLDPETTYIVQVRAYCGDDGYSAWLEGTFTTLPACMVPTGLVVSNIDKRSADLAWVSNGDEEAWQICVNGDEENLIYVTDTAYTLTGLEPDETLYTVKVRAYCDEQLQSAWSSPVTFYTLIACPAPTNLFISDIANISAVANWTGEGDFELQYAEDVWKYYDNGTYNGGIGTGGSDVYWAIMLPPTMLNDEPLTNVSVFEAAGYNTEPMTIMIYSGGDDAPGTLLYEETVETEAADAFHEITLGQPVTFDATQNLWIVCKEYGTYPAQGGTDTGDPNGRWISLDGEEWEDVASYSLYYTWMIRAAFGNNTQTEWVTIDNATSPQAITGLTPETNYLVRVKHVCGGIDGESVWTSTMFTTDIACPAPEALAVTPYALSAELSWEGISESYTVRYGYDEIDQTLYSEDFAEGIPADWTNDATYPWEVVDGYIQSSNAGESSSTSTISFTMNVSTDAYFEFDAKCMGEGTSSIWDKCIFTLDGTEMFRKGANGDQWDHYSYFITAGEHTFTWSYSKDSSVNPTGDYMAVDNIAIVTSHIVWNTVTAETNEYLLTGLTPLTTYHVQVQGDCGDFGTSEWSEMISFTTTEDTCPVPTNLTVDEETLTATTADLSWNGSPDVESFTVRYRAPQHAAEGALYETFGTSIPTGWTLYTGLLDTVMVRPSALTSANYGWNFGTGNNVFDNHARCNIYGTYQRWLVTPEVTVAAGANLAFDMALTVYTSSSNASPTPGNQADDKFIVLISTDSLQTWTILRQWDNQGSGYVYDEITNDANGQPVSIDLSAYVGQTVHIAFYGESTVSGGDNNLHIDNVIIGEVIPATDWQTVTTTDMNVTLTGLTPETTYEAQVKSDCSDPEEWTNTVNFTTLEYVMPTQTIALTTGANWVSFYVEITLNDLKAALVEALPGTNIVIKSRTQNTRYNGTRWLGSLTWDLSQMYTIIVASDCEIVMQGDQIDPSAHPATIKPGVNWIAYPLNENMSLTDAFAGFAIQNDVVKSRGGNAKYNRGRWQGSTLTTLEPGNGYYFISPASENRILVFPTPAK